jgi:hypothetical protein
MICIVANFFVRFLVKVHAGPELTVAAYFIAILLFLLLFIVLFLLLLLMRLDQDENIKFIYTSKLHAYPFETVICNCYPH